MALNAIKNKDKRKRDPKVREKSKLIAPLLASQQGSLSANKVSRIYCKLISSLFGMLREEKAPQSISKSPIK
jgi:hypothetical protein